MILMLVFIPLLQLHNFKIQEIWRKALRKTVKALASKKVDQNMKLITVGSFRSIVLKQKEINFLSAERKVNKFMYSLKVCSYTMTSLI